ncbi:MAG: energy transducer TonB [Candidatus Acidiferrales bacterium]
MNDTLLPDGESRWGSFGAGFGLEFIAVAAIVVMPMLMPQKLDAVKRYLVTPLEAPHIEAWKPQPKPQPVPVKREVVKEVPKPVEVVPPKPKIYNPVITSPIAKPVTVHKNLQAPDMTQVAKEFPTATPLGSSAIPTLKKPREAVQTGGFGDPNSVPDNGKRDRAVNMNQLGSYDLPAGPGYGNGTGGAKGARGVVASTGFGNGIAAGGNGSGGRGGVQQGVFADQQAAPPTVKQVAAAAPKTTPVEILFKPKPQYTDEARAKRIEGEVLLQVVFTAAGQVQVQHVVQGLGYGLNDAAEAAARQIRFRPAQQEGQPVDSTAIVHIVFELAF